MEERTAPKPFNPDTSRLQMEEIRADYSGIWYVVAAIIGTALIMAAAMIWCGT